MPDQSLTLRDAFAVYNAQVDLGVKFFTFLQVVSVAIAAFMWTGGHQPIPRLPVAVGFILFAAGNGVLLWQAYRVAERARGAIQRYREKHPEEIPEEFSPLFLTFQNYPGWQLAVIHIFADAVAIVAIVKAP